NKSPNFKKFHIIAALPTSMQAFMFTCSTFEADIFAMDPESKFNLRLNRKLYNQLVDRGYHFELLYGPAIEDSTKRKNLIHVSHLYHSFGKSKNIIFSSGAQSHLYIRSPYDIISLGLIFGLNELQCKNALTHYPKNTIINSVGRKHGKSIMFIENIEKESEQSVIILEESEGEDMGLNQPAQKRSKV
ncbi:ribonuclease P protein subunit p30, partial [Anoplophora glabripennis]